jgi:hypothetical protein
MSRSRTSPQEASSHGLSLGRAADDWPLSFSASCARYIVFYWQKTMTIRSLSVPAGDMIGPRGYVPAVPTVGDLLVRFTAILKAASAELFADNPGKMNSPDLLATSNAIDDGDLELFFLGIDAGLIRLMRGGKFNTFDRPKAGGRWSLLSRSKRGGWYNAEYLSQLAAYVDAIANLRYPKERVLFELPAESRQLDLAILDDAGHVVVLGEAKRDTGRLAKLVTSVETRFSTAPPSDESKKRGDEARQLAWRLWTVRAPICWMIAPGERPTYRCEFEPLRLLPAGDLPDARTLGLDRRPPRPLTPPRLA